MWRRNLEALLMQSLSLVILLVWWQNAWSALGAIVVMASALLWAMSKPEEMMDCLCAFLLNRWTLTALHYALHRPEIRLYPGLKRWA